MEKKKRICVYIILILLIIIAGTLIYEVFSTRPIDNTEHIGVEMNNIEAPKEVIISNDEFQEYLNNSASAEILEKKGNDVFDIVGYLNAYNNQEKMTLAINRLRRDAEINGNEIEYKKQDIIDKAKEIFGFYVELKFEDIKCEYAENEPDINPALYIYNAEEEKYVLNDEHAHGGSNTTVYNKVIDVQKNNNVYDVYVNTIFEMSNEGIAYDFYSDTTGEKVVKTISDDEKNMTENDNKYFDLINSDTYIKEGPKAYKEKMVDILFEGVNEGLNTYKFSIKVENGKYEIESFEKVDK